MPTGVLADNFGFFSLNIDRDDDVRACFRKFIF